jgi:hypothetical protein
MGTVYSNGMKSNKSTISKNQEYLDYIKEHINNVKLVYEKLFGSGRDIKLPEGISSVDFKNAVHAAGNEIAFHDSSKFSEDEFDAYRRHFHRTDEEILIDDTNPASAQEAESNFQKAWEHHYMNNNHHPQWWCYHDSSGARTPERVDPTPMSLDAIIHMICDWSAMSLKFDHTYSPLSWYATADKEKSFMHPETKRIVEELLNNLFGES